MSRYELHESPLVLAPKAVAAIEKALKYRHGGLQVLFAPPGAGKTTYLTVLGEKHRKAGHYVAYTTCVADKESLYTQLNIPNTGYLLSEVIPNGGVLIMDQMESITVTPELRGLLLELAVDSTMTKYYKVIIAVSNKLMAKEILKLNGGEKIRLLCKPADLMWGDDCVADYIRKSPHLRDLSTTDKTWVRELGCQAAAPAFLRIIAGDDCPHLRMHESETVAEAQTTAHF